VEQLTDARAARRRAVRGESPAGIDSGSWTTKAVVIDDSGAVLGAAVTRSGADLAAAAARAYDEALSMAGLVPDDISTVWSTGFGRTRWPSRTGRAPSWTATDAAWLTTSPGRSWSSISADGCQGDSPGCGGQSSPTA
jgi:hypothetical protein